MNKQACKHILFKGEEKYVICPDCGQVIAENMPKDSYLKAQIIKRSRKYKNWLKRKYFIFFLTGGPIFLLLLFPFLDNYFIHKYHMVEIGVTTFSKANGASSGSAIPFIEVLDVLFFLFFILVLPERNKRKSIRTWHMQNISSFLCRSWFYWILKLALYGLAYLFVIRIFSIYIYEKEIEFFQYILSSSERRYVALVYVKLSIECFYLGLGVLLLHNLWQCFYQRLAIHVNRPLKPQK